MEAQKRVEDFLREKIEKKTFSAASVTFGRASGEHFSVHTGKLSFKVDKPVDRNTVFDLQSMTKALVTAPLFLTLKKRERLDLSTKVADILGASSPMADKSAANTELVRLLTHSAGFSDQDMTGHFKTAYDLWDRIFTAARHYEPGSKVEYADASFRVLGKVIETVLGESLESASRRVLFNGSRSREMGYLPLNPFNVAGCPDAHGTIDDDHVRLLGEIVGCDGLFASSESIFELIATFMRSHSAIGEPLGPLLQRHVFAPPAELHSFFDALSLGPKTLGWEVNPSDCSYAGRFRTASTFEKSGGAGTFIWFDEQSGLICIYLTNRGKPKPFKPKSWNQLLEDVEPHKLANLIYESGAYR